MWNKHLPHIRTFSMSRAASVHAWAWSAWRVGTPLDNMKTDPTLSTCGVSKTNSELHVAVCLLFQTLYTLCRWTILSNILKTSLRITTASWLPRESNKSLKPLKGESAATVQIWKTGKTQINYHPETSHFLLSHHLSSSCYHLFRKIPVYILFIYLGSICIPKNTEEYRGFMVTLSNAHHLWRVANVDFYTVSLIKIKIIPLFYSSRRIRIWTISSGMIAESTASDLSSSSKAQRLRITVRVIIRNLSAMFTLVVAPEEWHVFKATTTESPFLSYQVQQDRKWWWWCCWLSLRSPILQNKSAWTWVQSSRGIAPM